jgi:methylated-DNA-protein-cysteine methyltransferase-like protein
VTRDGRVVRSAARTEAGGGAIGFDGRVHALVRRVPSGRVVTYGQVAFLLRAPRAARAVGHAMRRCPPGVPWHRVVNGEGRLSRRANLDGLLRQRLLLEGEGVRFTRSRIDLDRYGWRPRRAGRPGRSPGPEVR